MASQDRSPSTQDHEDSGIGTISYSSPTERCLPTTTEVAGVLAAENWRRGNAYPTADERGSTLWKTLGGTLLSMIGLVFITIFQSFSSSIQEIRTDVIRLNETRSDLIRRDEFSSRVGPLEANNSNVLVLKERLAMIQDQLKVSEEDRKKLDNELQQIRERLAIVASLTPVPGLIRVSEHVEPAQSKNESPSPTSIPAR